MLKALTIKNIALIDSLEIEFLSGLNILSGETGAGKSIIIDSLNFVLGARADKNLIRYNTDQAVVEAEFFGEISDMAKLKLDDMDIDYKDGVIISRSLTMEGRNVCRINGIKVSASVLKDIACLLVDIYGQHDTTQLFNPSGHLPIIDAYGRDIISKSKVNFNLVYDEYKSVVSQLKKYGSLSNVKERMAEITEDIDIIKSAKIKQGEEDSLSEKLSLIESSGEIIDAIEEVSDSLSSRDGAVKMISTAIKSLKNYAAMSQNIADSITRLESAYYEVEDIADVLIRERAKVDFDEREESRVTDRLNYIRDVIKDYGGSEASTLSRLAAMEDEYNYLADSEYEVIELGKKKTALLAKLYAAATALSKARRMVATKFEAGVLAELAELSMGKTKFVSSFQDVSQEEFLKVISTDGIDSMEFLISPNPGQPLKPLSKIISGGEMSRFMLAIKKLTADIDGINVMVFDEVDTGISGDVAGVVARKLSDLSASKQVLAITHLPQLASYADVHYYIDKVSDDTSTKSSVSQLDSDGMLRELARLIGGGSDSETSMNHAREIKAKANSYKANR